MIQRSNLSTFQDDVRSRLTIERSIDDPSNIVEAPEPIADSPNPDRQVEETIRLEDSRSSVYDQQRTRSSNLPSRPSSNYRDLLRPIEDSNSVRTTTNIKTEAKPASKAYVVLPSSLLGIKLDEGSASALAQGAQGAALGSSIGSVVPVIGNVVGGVLGAIGGLGVKIFGIGQSKDIWFDVVYKDALQKAFEGLGYPTSEPYDGKLTQRSQFHIKKSISISDMRKVIQEFNNSIAKEFSGNSRVLNGLANVTISTSYNKTQTAFSFSVLNEQPAKKPVSSTGNGSSGSGSSGSGSSGSGASSAGGSTGVKGAVGIGAIIGLITLLKS